MPQQQTATMAAHARAAQARVDWTEHCLDRDDLARALSGWRAVLAAAIIACGVALLALPVVAVLALLFVVAAVLISRPDAQK